MEIPMAPSRISEIDISRGVAIVLMILYHIVFDLNFFFGFKQLDYSSGFLFLEGRLSAILFILVSGVSTSLLFQRHAWHIAWRRNLRRFFLISFFACLISLVTWFFAARYTILFGILHFLSLSVLLSVPFVRFRWINIILGCMIIILQPTIYSFFIISPLLLPIGFGNPSFITFDYFPLFPWFGITLLGIGMGNMLYPRERQKPLFQLQGNLFPLLEWAGKRSLWIYLLHQPIILLCLWFLYGKPTIL